MLVTPRKLLATMVIIAASTSCGGSPSVLETPTAPAPALASRPPMQDQRILLEPIRVDASADPTQLEASTGDGQAVAALHSSDELARRVREGAGDLRACVRESSLDMAVEISRELVLNLEIDGSGRVLGGVTTPGGGEEGLPAVADCLLSKARGWAFPKRTTPGSTVLVIPYQLVFAAGPEL